MVLKLSSIYKNHGISILDDDLTAISSQGHLIAILKNDVLYIYKINGDILKMLFFERALISQIYFLKNYLILIGKKNIQLYNIKENKICDSKNYNIIGCNINKDRILIVTKNEFLIFKIERDLLSLIEACSENKMYNVFGYIEYFKYHPKKLKSSELFAKKLGLKTFKIKNVNQNSLMPIFDKKSLKCSKFNFDYHKEFRIFFRSISAFYKHGKLLVYKNEKKKLKFYGNIKFLRIFKYNVIFSTDTHLYVYNIDKLKKYRIKVNFLSVNRTGVFIITKDKFLTLNCESSNLNKISKILRDSELPFFISYFPNIIQELKLANEYEVLFKILKIMKHSIYPHLDDFFISIFSSGMTDKELIILINRILKEYNFSHFYTYSCLAKKYNRVQFSQFLIQKEKNRSYRLKYLKMFKDIVFMIKYIEKETDNSFLHLIFSDIDQLYTENDMITILSNQIVYQKYINFMKTYPEKYQLFMKKNCKNCFYVFNKQDSTLITPSDKNFYSKMIEILRAIKIQKMKLSKNKNMN